MKQLNFIHKEQQTNIKIDIIIPQEYSKLKQTSFSYQSATNEFHHINVYVQFIIHC